MLRVILKAMFSDYNGVQIFLYPTLLFFWLSHEAAVASFSTLLSLRLHYLPLVFYSVLLIYVCFMALKVYTVVFDAPRSRYEERMNEFKDLIIKLHLLLFYTVIVLMVFYVLTRFLGYFYGIELPLKQGVMYMFKMFTTSLILFFYIYTIWLKPFRDRDLSTRHCQNKCIIWIARNPFVALKFTVIMLLVITISVQLYLLSMNYLIHPLQKLLANATGVKLSIILLPMKSVGSLIINILMLAAAFLLSNLLFYPFILLGNKAIMTLHPILQEEEKRGKAQN